MTGVTRINLIGTGRVGRTLMKLLSGLPGFALVGVAGRHGAAARTAVRDAGINIPTYELEDLPQADLWLLAVADDGIADVADQIAALSRDPSFAVHFSGYHLAAQMNALEGWSLASAHPNLSFANPDVAAAEFAGTFVGLEGDDPACVTAASLMSALGAECFRIGATAKPLYHAAAVIANNFPVVLQALAREAWAEAGVPEEVARHLGPSLLRAASRNLRHLEPAEALTGPAARGDTGVVQVETAALGEWRADAGELYAELSRLAARLKVSGRTDG